MPRILLSDAVPLWVDLVSAEVLPAAYLRIAAESASQAMKLFTKRKLAWFVEPDSIRPIVIPAATARISTTLSKQQTQVRIAEALAANDTEILAVDCTLPDEPRLDTQFALAFYVSRSMDTLRDIQQSYEHDRWTLTFHKRLGELLSVPECCITAFVNDEYLGFHPAQRYEEQKRSFKQNEEQKEAITFLVDSLGMVPCSPNCGRALTLATELLRFSKARPTRAEASEGM